MTISNTVQKLLAKIDPSNLFPPIPKKLHNQRVIIEAVREFVTAYEMRGYANKRFDVAKEVIDRLHVTDGFISMKPGMNKTLWQDEDMMLMGSLNNPVVSTDFVKLKNELTILLGQDKTEALLKKCEKIAKPARRLTVSYT